MRTHEWKQMLTLCLLLGLVASIGFLAQPTRALDIQDITQALPNTSAVEASLPLADDLMHNTFIGKTLGAAAPASGIVVLPSATNEPDNVRQLAALQEATTKQFKDDGKEAERSNDRKQQVATITDLEALPDLLTVDFGEDSDTPEANLRTVYNSELEEAGFYFNDTEVFRFRSTIGDLSPYLRSKQVANRLSQHMGGSLTYRDVHLDFQDDGNYNLMLGKNIITVVDQETADSAEQSLRSMAKCWMKELRSAMGEESTVVKSVFNQKNGRYLGHGQASWYGPGFHGRTAADGSRFNMYAMTAAHKTLPFGTQVRVTNTRNGKSCIVRITDRGPYAHGRVIDLSKAAAKEIGVLATGVASVKLEKI